MGDTSITLKVKVGVPGTTDSDQWFTVNVSTASEHPKLVPKAVVVDGVEENRIDVAAVPPLEPEVPADNEDVVVDSQPSRFAYVGPHKLFLHHYIDLLRFRTLHAIDTKYGHTKRLIKRHPVRQMGYDFGVPSSSYLATVNQHPEDVIWLDYCCTPNHMAVREDLKLCRTKWVFCTFSTRGTKWKSIVKRLPNQTLYRYAWHYTYTDSSHMVFVAYSVSKAPPLLKDPVGRTFKFEYESKMYTRKCEALLCGPPDDIDHVYLKFRDSNEPLAVCKLVKGS